MVVRDLEITADGGKTLDGSRPSLRYGVFVQGKYSATSHITLENLTIYKIYPEVGAEHEGINAVVIDCMGDPGLFAARELVSIPVVGAAQASMSLAATLADRFSIIGILERDRSTFRNLWRLYDLAARGASVRVIDIPVLSLHDDDEELIKAMVTHGELAISEDHAHALVFGCTGMGGLTGPVERGLAEKGYAGVPVIDPTGVALKQAESLLALGLSHSKQTFPKPPEKKIAGYDTHQL